MCHVASYRGRPNNDAYLGLLIEYGADPDYLCPPDKLLCHFLVVPLPKSLVVYRHNSHMKQDGLFDLLWRLYESVIDKIPRLN